MVDLLTGQCIAGDPGRRLHHWHAVDSEPVMEHNACGKLRMFYPDKQECCNCHCTRELTAIPHTCYDGCNCPVARQARQAEDEQRKQRIWHRILERIRA